MNPEFAKIIMAREYMIIEIKITLMGIGQQDANV